MENIIEATNVNVTHPKNYTFKILKLQASIPDGQSGGQMVNKVLIYDSTRMTRLLFQAILNRIVAVPFIRSAF